MDRNRFVVDSVDIVVAVHNNDDRDEKIHKYRSNLYKILIEIIIGMMMITMKIAWNDDDGNDNIILFHFGDDGILNLIM